MEIVDKVITPAIDTAKEFINLAKERIANPLLGSFIISFVVWNWKPFALMILSDKSVEERIAFIESFHTDNINFEYPLYFTLAYVLLLPFSTWLVTLILSFPTKGTYAINFGIEQAKTQLRVLL